MKRLAAIGPVGLLIVTGAYAQTNPFTIRGGYGYAFEKGANGSGDASGYTLGLGWDFWQQKATHTRVSLDLDWSNNDLRGDKIETGSLQVVGRMPLGIGKGLHFYGGLGVGAYHSFVGGSTSTFTGSQTITTSFSNTETEIGGELLLGVRIDEHWGLEAYYRLTEVNNGVEPNTIGVVASFHF